MLQLDFADFECNNIMDYFGEFVKEKMRYRNGF